MAKIELSVPKLDESRILDRTYQDELLSWCHDATNKALALQEQIYQYGGLSPQAIAMMPALFAKFMQDDEGRAHAALNQASLYELEIAMAETHALFAEFNADVDAMQRRVLGASAN